MTDYEKDKAIDEFVSQLDRDYNDLKTMFKFIIIEDERYQKLINESLDILKHKIKAIIHSDSHKDVKKHVKLKKLFKKYGDKNGR